MRRASETPLRKAGSYWNRVESPAEPPKRARTSQRNPIGPSALFCFDCSVSIRESGTSPFVQSNPCSLRCVLFFSSALHVNMATQVVHRGPTFESFLSSRPDPFGDSHLPEPLHAAPSLVALEIRSQVDFSQLLTPKLSMSTPIDGATPPCAASPSTKSLRNDPVEVQARSGYQEAANFVAPILEEDEPETDNQFTVTSLSGKPLLASTAAARIASRKSREKTNKVSNIVSHCPLRCLQPCKPRRLLWSRSNLSKGAR